MTSGANKPSGPKERRSTAIDDLDRRFRRPLVSYFEKRIRERYDVDDLVQEVLILQTAANVMRDRVRRQAVRHADDHAPLENCELPTNDFSPERVLQSRQLLEKALAALRGLPARTREVFVLRLYEGLKHEEIANSLNMSVEGVRFHLRRAKAHLAKALEQDA
jgi:DNA-directed RNA polymerase specialized sigma24 family protein